MSNKGPNGIPMSGKKGASKGKRLRQKVKNIKPTHQWYKIAKKKSNNFCVIMGPYNSKVACMTDRQNCTNFWDHSKAVKGERKAHRLFKQMAGVRHHNDRGNIVDAFEDLSEEES